MLSQTRCSCCSFLTIPRYRGHGRSIASQQALATPQPQVHLQAHVYDSSLGISQDPGQGEPGRAGCVWKQ